MNIAAGTQCSVNSRLTSWSPFTCIFHIYVYRTGTETVRKEEIVCEMFEICMHTNAHITVCFAKYNLCVPRICFSNLFLISFLERNIAYEYGICQRICYRLWRDSSDDDEDDAIDARMFRENL